ncbi:uncharacterized protein DUF4174 [Mucilaginibacter gracilis]|uniref:Uncharacterized protein DUF4174 n=1 Tax=Mucilaginibacter gracilis TaxID=423350 RepID=A0A495J7B5_9SPHI|nr:DUF4174 domain-containing protein [Mucilaginibacter gracilis]RKR83909.1 uncharacterized protein DUF4174 [Mucilaginibacter gracilis]
MQIKILIIFAACLWFKSQGPANHCVFIFADKTNNADLIRQINILKADPNGTNSRNIIYKVVTYSANNAEHYKKWKVSNVPFTVILIGNDNGEKLRSHQPVSLAKIFELVDNTSRRREQGHHKL